MKVDPGAVRFLDTMWNADKYEPIFGNLTKWAIDDWNDKMGNKQIPIQKWILISNKDMPQQVDSINCGVFVIKSAKISASGNNPEHILNEKDGTKYRRELLASILYNNDL